MHFWGQFLHVESIVSRVGGRVMTSNVQSHCTHTTHTHTEPSSFHSLFQVFSFCFLALQIQDKTHCSFLFNIWCYIIPSIQVLYSCGQLAAGTPSIYFVPLCSCFILSSSILSVSSFQFILLLAILCVFFVVHSLVPHFIYLLCGSFLLGLLTLISTIFFAVHALMLHFI